MKNKSLLSFLALGLLAGAWFATDVRATGKATAPPAPVGQPFVYKIDPAFKAEHVAAFWNATAAHWAKTDQLNQSYSPQQRELMALIFRIDQDLEMTKRQLQADCPKSRPLLDVSGAQPVCKKK